MATRITNIPSLPPRDRDAHKGHFGRVLIVGGSPGMIGAPALAANAAFRSGAGLVRMALPRRIQQASAVLACCATSICLPDDAEGQIRPEALGVLLEAIEQNDSVALGPGLGRVESWQSIVEVLLRECRKPLVIDADGLHALAALLRGAGRDLALSPDTVLTPHPGEFAVLWRACFREELPADRTEQAERLAERLGAVVVLKGAGTVVTDGQAAYVNTTGNPGMASGGSGDVLTGVIAALLARRPPAGTFNALEAAILAVYVHGRAGDLAARQRGQTALTALDQIDGLCQAWQERQR